MSSMTGHLASGESVRLRYLDPYRVLGRENPSDKRVLSPTIDKAVVLPRKAIGLEYGALSLYRIEGFGFQSLGFHGPTARSWVRGLGSTASRALAKPCNIPAA